MSKSTQARRRSPDASIVTRRASINASSFNAKENTFSAVISAGTPVKRRDPFDGSLYFEALAITPAAVRLGRVKDGVVPLLNSHRSNSLADRLGIVTATRMEYGRLIADIRLSQSDDANAVAADIAAGTPPNVSIGYQVHAMTEAASSRGDTPTHTATDWELMEVSLVPIPADPKTHIRSQKGLDMDDQDEGIDTNDDHNEAGDRSGSDVRAMSDRHARQAYDLAARANLPADFARQHIDRGVTLQEFRGIIFDKKAGDADRTRTGSIGFGGHQTFADPEFLGRSIQDALVARMTGKPPAAAASEFMGRSMLELGEMLLRSRGERVSWSDRSRIAEQMLERSSGYHTTSDFPILLQGAGDRVLRDAYQASETPLKRLALRRNARDFRPMTSVQVSDAPRLLKVGESGEVKYGTRGEEKEVGKIDTYGRMFSISRQAIVNDDLDAFGRSARDWGRAAAETETDLLVGLLTANSGNGVKLGDGNPVYGTSRGNKAAAGTVISPPNLSTARQALREVKGLDGKTPISVTPKYLLVGAAKETEGEMVLADLAAASVDDVNPFSGKLTLLVEPRLPGNAWRLFAEPTQVPSIVASYLNGEAAPHLDIVQGWTTLGVEFRAYLDFGCWMEDWRGTYLNPGN